MPHLFVEGVALVVSRLGLRLHRRQRVRGSRQLPFHVRNQLPKRDE